MERHSTGGRGQSARIGIGLLAIAGLAASASADFTFGDFGSTDDLNLQGSGQFASEGGDNDPFVLRLTDGQRALTSVWHDQKQNVADAWEVNFSFQVTNVSSGTGPDPTKGADGFAFLIQNTSPTLYVDTASTRGGGLGYNQFNNIVAVEFDMWKNARAGDLNGNHISVHNNFANNTSTLESHSLGAATNIPNMSDESIYDVRLAYTPGTLEIFLNEQSVLTVAMNIAERMVLDNGSAWIGFTAATGAQPWQTQDILNWGFAEIVPAPSGVALLAGAGLLAGRRRRR
ncbi:MAG: hypothetical protein H6811_03440 [Phycisphaeraceae bacterium]|nr:hypothetical protein [Phycisphaeraceae bacterium]